MGEKEVNAESLASDRQQRRFGWLDVSLSAFIVLVITVPTMAIEETWHGYPMIDQQNHLWLAPAFLVVAAFFSGGVLTGYRRPAAAAAHSSAADAVAVAILLVAAFARRHWLAHEGLPGAVVQLWCFGGVSAISISVAGSQLGRRLALGSR